MKDFPNLRVMKKIGHKWLMAYETEHTENYCWVFTDPKNQNEWTIDMSNPIDERKYHLNISKSSKMGQDIMMQIILLDESKLED